MHIQPSQINAISQALREVGYFYEQPCSEWTAALHRSYQEFCGRIGMENALSIPQPARVEELPLPLQQYLKENDLWDGEIVAPASGGEGEGEGDETVAPAAATETTEPDAPSVVVANADGADVAEQNDPLAGTGLEVIDGGEAGDLIAPAKVEEAAADEAQQEAAAEEAPVEKASRKKR